MKLKSFAKLIMNFRKKLYITLLYVDLQINYCKPYTNYQDNKYHKRYTN